MTGHQHQPHMGFGIMSRVRPTCSHQNLQCSMWSTEQQLQPGQYHHNAFKAPHRNKSLSSASTSPVAAASATHSRRRNHSVSHTAAPSNTTRQRQPHSKISDAGHWPPLEFDPLKLNPTTVTIPAVAEPTTTTAAEKPPPRLYERDLLRNTSLRSPTQPQQHQTFFQPRSRPRLYHSDSGISFDYDTYTITQKQLAPLPDDNQKSWPSPASSVDSGKSWFDLEDDDDDVSDDDESVTSDDSDAGPEDEDKEFWTGLPSPPSPQRRPQVGSPDDPTNYLKRGAWKRRGIFFGQQSNEVYEKEDDAFDL